MRPRIAGLSILIRVIGVGILAPVFFATLNSCAVSGLDGRGADDHLVARAFSKSTFSFELLVRCGENAFCIRALPPQEPPHPGIASCPHDGAARLSASLFSLVNHGMMPGCLSRNRRDSASPLSTSAPSALMMRSRSADSPTAPGYVAAHGWSPAAGAKTRPACAHTSRKFSMRATAIRRYPPAG